MDRKELLDTLVQKIRLEGYQIVSRKHGKFLPAPPPVGSHEIDVLAKRNNKFVIGLAVTSEEVKKDGLKDKLAYLATRTSRYSNLPVILFIGVEQSQYVKLAQILQQIPAEVKRQIRTFPVSAEPEHNLFFNGERGSGQGRYFN